MCIKALFSHSCGDWSAASSVSHADEYVETLRSALSADSLRLLSMIHASSTPNVAAWVAYGWWFTGSWCKGGFVDVKGFGRGKSREEENEEC